MLQCINQTILQDPDSWLHDRLLKLCDMELVSHSIISLFCKLAICKSGWRIPLLILLILQTCNLQIWMRIPFMYSDYSANLQFANLNGNSLPAYCLFCKLAIWEFPSCILLILQIWMRIPFLYWQQNHLREPGDRALLNSPWEVVEEEEEFAAYFANLQFANLDEHSILQTL